MPPLMPLLPLPSWRRMLLLTALLSTAPAIAQTAPVLVPTESPPGAREQEETPAASPAEDDEPEWTQALSLEELLQVELSAPAKRLQKAREAPGVASVVTREQMSRFGWTSLNDVLFSQPGFFPSQDYERGVVGARGLWEGWNNNHLLLLVDGVPMNDADTSAALTWEITPLFMVKSVEIVRGPASSLYGSSAINGVIALNTLSSARTLDEGERLEVNSEARLRAGNLGTTAVDVVAVTHSRHISAVVGFQHQRSDGFSYLSYDGSGRTDATGALQRFRVRDPRDSDYLFVKLEPLKTLEGLSVQYHLQRWSSGTGTGWLQWTPDLDSSLHDRRHLAVLRYRSPQGSRLEQEYVLQYQRHEFDYNVRFYPSGALDGQYPAGVSEVLKSSLDSFLGRAQLSYSPTERLTLLAGAEHSFILYGGDSVHYSNAELANEAQGYPASEAPVQLGPSYEPILGEPMNNMGAYTQLSWSRLLDLPLSLTLGARYDRTFFYYRDIREPAKPRRFKTYGQLSPRVALVYTPSPSLSLKLQAGRAFRAPSPSELFGSNTWTTQSDLDTLRPEQVTTFELNADWSLNRHLTWRGTLFHSRYDNLTGYTLNVLSNLLSQTNAGVESELLAEVDLGEQGRLSAYGNYTYVRLLGGADSGGQSPGHEGHLTWAPAHLAKAGVSYSWERFSLALQGRYQGEVHRREEDRATPSYAAARPAQVPAWFRLDANARYQFTHWAAAELRVSNLLDAESYLVTPGDFPFDYRMEGRRVLASLEINL